MSVTPSAYTFGHQNYRTGFD